MEKNTISSNLLETPIYRVCKRIAHVMDSCYLDPILGFVFPGSGDTLLQILNIPCIYIAAIKLRSFPLTLAIVYNMLVDILIGLFSLLGDIADVFNKSYNKNINLITGFIEGNDTAMLTMNRNSRIMVIIIIILILIIYVVRYLVGMFWDFIASLF
ncbi:MAG: DUF4112 domain-containing protein [Bacteroidales bacterium]|nr:DUF4112 domain-containing protein [Bacteroidales bacterium]